MLKAMVVVEHETTLLLLFTEKGFVTAVGVVVLCVGIGHTH